MEEPQKVTRENETIVRLDPREHVRKRPGMYIGGIDQRAMHNLIDVIINHSIELAFAGLCDHIWITLRDNNEICIRDNGPEIPYKTDETSGKSMLEAFMTELGVTEQRVNGFTGTYYRGMFSTGFLAINALSEKLSIESTYDGHLWKQEYKVGVPQTKVTQICELEADGPRGMAITLRPDFTIFEAAEFDYEAIVKRVRESAYLAAGVTITVVDERKSPTLQTEFHFPNGMADLVRDCNKNQTVLHEIVHYQDHYTADDINRHGTYEVEFALQFNDSSETVIKSYVNTWCTDGGTHVGGLESAMVKIINAKAANQPEVPFTWGEIKVGLTVGLSIKMANPSFESQTKINLINPEVYYVVAEIISSRLSAESFDAIIKRCEAGRKAGNKKI